MPDVMSTKSSDNAATAGRASRVEGRDVAIIRQQILDEPATGARLFQRLRVAEGTADRRRRRRSAVRTRAPAARRALSAAEVSRDHAKISRSNDPGVEALEV